MHTLTKFDFMKPSIFFSILNPVFSLPIEVSPIDGEINHIWLAIYSLNTSSKILAMEIFTCDFVGMKGINKPLLVCNPCVVISLIS